MAPADDPVTAAPASQLATIAPRMSVPERAAISRLGTPPGRTMTSAPSTISNVVRSLPGPGITTRALALQLPIFGLGRNAQPRSDHTQPFGNTGTKTWDAERDDRRGARHGEDTEDHCRTDEVSRANSVSGEPGGSADADHECQSGHRDPP